MSGTAIMEIDLLAASDEADDLWPVPVLRIDPKPEGGYEISRLSLLTLRELVEDDA